jgi:hypothetical protein
MFKNIVEWLDHYVIIWLIKEGLRWIEFKAWP